MGKMIIAAIIVLGVSLLIAASPTLALVVLAISLVGMFILSKD